MTYNKLRLQISDVSLSRIGLTVMLFWYLGKHVYGL